MGFVRILRRGVLGGAVAVCLLAAFASPAVSARVTSATPALAGPGFTFRTFDVPTGGGTYAFYTDILGINNRGVMVGQYCATFEAWQNYQCYGFIANGQHVTTVQVPTSHSTLIQSINDAGTAVGSWGEHGVPHGFIRSASGVITTISDPAAGSPVYSATQLTGGVTEEVTGVNDEGVMVGSFVDHTGVEHGFIDQHGQFTTVDNPKYPATTTAGTELWGINNLGVIDGLGYSWPDVAQGLTLSPPTPRSQYTYFTGLGENVGGYYSNGGTFPQAINDFGTVVGHSNGWESYGVFTGWERLSNGSQIQISDPNASTTIPHIYGATSAVFGGTAPGGINDLGTVTGIYFVYDPADEASMGDGFIATPTW